MEEIFDQYGLAIVAVIGSCVILTVAIGFVFGVGSSNGMLSQFIADSLSSMIQ